MPDTPKHSEADLRRATEFRLSCRNGRARSVRAAAGASLAETARVAGVSKGLLWSYEKGEVVPGLANAVKLSRIYRSYEKALRADSARGPWAPNEKGSPSEAT